MSERIPSLPAIKDALRQMQVDFEKLDYDSEILFTRVKILNQKLRICCEALDELLGEQPRCPEVCFPELNGVDDV